MSVALGFSWQRAKVGGYLLLLVVGRALLQRRHFGEEALLLLLLLVVLNISDANNGRFDAGSGVGGTGKKETFTVKKQSKSKSGLRSNWGPLKFVVVRNDMAESLTKDLTQIFDCA